MMLILKKGENEEEEPIWKEEQEIKRGEGMEKVGL